MSELRNLHRKILGPPKVTQSCATTRYITSCDWWKNTPSSITTHHVASCNTKIVPFFMVLAQLTCKLCWFDIQNLEEYINMNCLLLRTWNSWGLAFGDKYIKIKNKNCILKHYFSHFINSFYIQLNKII